LTQDPQILNGPIEQGTKNGIEAISTAEATAAWELLRVFHHKFMFMEG
jgi:hypothetical protein